MWRLLVLRKLILQTQTTSIKLCGQQIEYAQIILDTVLRNRARQQVDGGAGQAAC